MTFTKAKISLFLGAVLVLGWLLYPRSVFLGYIYEGKSRLIDAEKYYQNFLTKNPYNKFATFRLASLYEKTGQPEKATFYLEQLFDYRKKDWEVAEKYLSHLDNLAEGEKLFHVRLDIVRRFESDPLFPKGRLEEVLYEALQYARWTQKQDQVISILESLIKIGRNKQSYLEQLELLKASMHDDESVLKGYQLRLTKTPDDRSLREDLIAVYQVLGKKEEAIDLINVALTKEPFDSKWIALRLEFYQRQKKWILAEQDARLLLSSLAKSSSEESLVKHIYYTELLGDLLKKQNRDKEALKIYKNLLDENPSRRESWLNLVYYYSEHKSLRELKNILALYTQKFPEDQERQKIYEEFLFYETSGTKALRIGERMLQQNPRNSSVILRMAYLFADQKDFDSAKNYFERYAHHDPRNSKTLLVVGKELHSMGYYQEAEKYLRDAVKRRQSGEARHWLAENQWILAIHAKEKRLWKKAITFLDDLYESGIRDITSIQPYEIERERALLHKKYDTRLSSRFEMSHMDNDTWKLWTQSYSHYFSDWHLLSNIQWGDYDVTSPAGSWILQSHSELIYERPDWKWGMGLGVGGGGQRQVISPSLKLGYGEDKVFNLELKASLRDLRTDLSSFVAQGAIQDEASVAWQSIWSQRVIFSGYYKWIHTTLNNSNSAQEHHLEPALAFVIFHKPYVSVGYQFSFEQVIDRGLLAFVPLIPQTRTHYLTALMNIPLGHTASLEGGAYLGEDTSRHLHLFHGDLFGLRAQAEWAILPGLDASMGYEYGRQTQNSLAGQSHRGMVQLSIHW